VIRLISFVFVLACAAVSLATAGARPAAAQTGPTGSVRVAAAADLKFALDEAIGRLSRQDRSLRIEPVYGSSGNFHAQLRQRAPFDLYLSADVEYPRDLVARGIGDAGDLFVYAVGRLVVWVPNGSTLAIEREGLGALARARRIAIANPRHAPYGRAAEAALRDAGMWTRVEGRLVYGENIAQAAQFVQGGAADAGLIARSLAVAPAMREAGRYREVPLQAHPALLQGGLVLPWASSATGARRVRDYLVSAEGRALLASYGFDLPESDSSPVAGAR
jgi:molybdate transport system substrate-binding protein